MIDGEIQGDGMDVAAAAFDKLPPMQALNEDRDGTEPEVDDDEVDVSTEIDDDGDTEEGEPDTVDDQDDEPEAPAIDPPVSWDAARKELFAQLPPDAQQYIVERDTQANRAVQAATTEKAEAVKTVNALTEHATQLHRQFAEQLAIYHNAFEPQRPDPSLIATDPARYAVELADYEQLTAHREEIAKRAEAARQQAEQIDGQRRQMAQDAEEAELRSAIPEYADPAGKLKVLQDFIEVAKGLGYDPEHIQGARPVDILAVRRASEWKGKADKYDALQAKRMESVRAAKGKPKVATPGTAQPKGSARAQGLQDSMQRLRSTGTVKDAAAALSRIL